jgi:hypothetical protein
MICVHHYGKSSSKDLSLDGEVLGRRFDRGIGTIDETLAQGNDVIEPLNAKSKDRRFSETAA